MDWSELCTRVQLLQHTSSACGRDWSRAGSASADKTSCAGKTSITPAAIPHIFLDVQIGQALQHLPLQSGAWHAERAGDTAQARGFSGLRDQQKRGHRQLCRAEPHARCFNDSESQIFRPVHLASSANGELGHGWGRMHRGRSGIHLRPCRARPRLRRSRAESRSSIIFIRLSRCAPAMRSCSCHGSVVRPPRQREHPAVLPHSRS